MVDIVDVALGGEPQTVYNAKKKSGRIKFFIRWAARLKYVSRDGLVALELVLEDGPNVDPEGGYRAFSSDELQRIFGSSAYTDKTLAEAWQYFAPLLAMYTGARARDELTGDDFA